MTPEEMVAKLRSDPAVVELEAEHGIHAPEVDEIVRMLDLTSGEQEAEQEILAEAKARHLHLGDKFALDGPEQVPAIWGSGEDVLWSEGESLIIVGPAGVGKTTLALQLLKARIGIGDEQVLGFPVQEDSRPTLYLAMDRPSQLRRAMTRIFREEDRVLLAERLRVWSGPLPVDLGRNSDFLLQLAEVVGAGTVIIDSLKDAAIKLSDDEVGGTVNRSMQRCVANGVEVLALHHQRKGQGGSRPTTLEDVYGSTWVVAGAGSVVLLWGAAGDPIVGLSHLKQPMAEIGPLSIGHDHLTGISSIERGQVDPLKVLQSFAIQGLGSTQLARVMFERDIPDKVQVRKALRQLERLTRDGLAIMRPGGRQDDGRQSPNLYYPAAVHHGESPHDH